MINFNKKTPLYKACSNNKSEIALELLKKHDIDVNKSGKLVITNQIELKSKKRFILFFYLLFFFFNNRDM